MPMQKRVKTVKKKTTKSKIPPKRGLQPQWFIGEARIARIPVLIETTGKSPIRTDYKNTKFLASKTKVNKVHYIALIRRTGVTTFHVINQVPTPFTGKTFDSGHRERIAKFLGLDSVPKHFSSIAPEFVQNLKT